MNQAKKGKMRKSQLTIKFHESILNILSSKDECKSAFQLNKYIFFIHTVRLNSEFNSHELYRLLKLKNNAAGATIKRNLIDWEIIKQVSGVSYQQHSNGTFKANNLARYEINHSFLFDKKIDYVLLSDKAKFINHPLIYQLTDGLIVEAVTEKKTRKPRTKKIITPLTINENMKILAKKNYLQESNMASPIASDIKPQEATKEQINVVVSELPKETLEVIKLIEIKEAKIIEVKSKSGTFKIKNENYSDEILSLLSVKFCNDGKVLRIKDKNNKQMTFGQLSGVYEFLF